MGFGMTVRDATIDDIDQIVLLAKKFHEVSGYGFLEFDEETVANLVGQSIGCGLCPVAEVDGKVVGFLAGLCFPALLNANLMVGTEIAWWLEPEFRNGPIGVKLLLAAESRAKGKGLKFWSMMCLEHLNADGLEDIYERLGYKRAERTYLKVF